METDYKPYCENVIGTVQIPLGLAGPLPLKGEFWNGEYQIPLATTEACLVASVNRGAKALRFSGGTDVEVELIGVSRAPVFKLKHAISAEVAEALLRKNEEKMREIIAKGSEYLELLNFEIHIVDDLLFVRFFFDSKDAMGMNMTTFASDQIAQKLICPLLNTELVSLSSNFCSDKKPCRDHRDMGRGFRARARAQLSAQILKEVLKTSAEKMMEVYRAKLVEGSMLAGAQAQNAHHANVVAALFAATGQDLAHVVEGSMGSTHLRRTGDDLEISIEVPALLCGVVGGGTDLPSFQKVLSLIGLHESSIPGQKNKEFAGVIAGAVLAGELSLLACLAENQLAQTHLKARDLKSKK